LQSSFSDANNLEWRRSYPWFYGNQIKTKEVSLFTGLTTLSMMD